jgi:hypothetical protein
VFHLHGGGVDMHDAPTRAQQRRHGVEEGCQLGPLRAVDMARHVAHALAREPAGVTPRRHGGGNAAPAVDGGAEHQHAARAVHGRCRQFGGHERKLAVRPARDRIDVVDAHVDPGHAQTEGRQQGGVVERRRCHHAQAEAPAAVVHDLALDQRVLLALEYAVEAADAATVG